MGMYFIFESEGLSMAMILALKMTISLSGGRATAIGCNSDE
jgi:hypothetical protein